MKLSIRLKLLIGFILLLTLSLFLQIFAFNITKDYIAYQTQSVLLEKARSASSQIERIFFEMKDHNTGLGSIYKLNPTEKNKNVVLLANYIINSEHIIRKISVLLPSGREILRIDSFGETPAAKLSYEVSTEQFEEAKRGSDAYSKVYDLDSLQGPYIDIFSPIFLNKQSILGVVKMQVNLSDLWNFISEVKLGDNGYAYVVDNDGRLIAHPNKEYLKNRPNLSSRRLIKLLLENKSTNQLSTNDFMYVNEKNVTVIAQAISIPELHWYVIFEQPISEAFTFINFIRNLFIFTLLGSLGVLLLIAFLLSDNLTRPILKLQSFTKKIENGDLTTKINLDTHDELEALGDSINNMAGQLILREQNIRKNSQQLEILIQSLTDGVVATDDKNNIILFNKSAEKITGLTREHVLGKPIDSVLRLCEENQCVTLSMYSRQDETFVKKLRDTGLTLKVSERKRIFLSIRVSPITVDTQPNTKSGWIMTFHDITKEQELEEMKLDFVSMAAHELRTPLTAIRGYAQLLKEDLPENSPPDNIEFVNRLVVSSENLSNLIDNLLNVSRIERNTFKVDTKPLDILPLATDIVDSLQEQARTKNQTLDFIKPQDILPLAMADKFRLTQVLSNLVANAINYTPEGGVITVMVELKGSFFEFAVRDTGIGIPEDALPKLFSKFFRVSGKLEEGSKGTGLGLFIAKSIVDMHKGKIWVESVRGRGSTFHFTIPKATAEEIIQYNKPEQPSTLTGVSKHGIIINNERYEQLFGKKNTDSGR